VVAGSGVEHLGGSRGGDGPVDGPGLPETLGERLYVAKRVHKHVAEAIPPNYTFAGRSLAKFSKNMNSMTRKTGAQTR
jgi:hypothetical protein